MDVSSDPKILEALDGLLLALDLEPIGNDRFRATNEPKRFPRVFGGQLVAQALQAMAATVDDLAPNSLHAYFADGGLPDQPIEISIDRMRDGRTMATRRASITQGDRTVLVAIGSFHTNTPGIEVSAPAPVVAPPESLPTLQDWARAALDRAGDLARLWIDVPPPLDIRMGESPTFLTREHGDGERSHWLRLPRPVGDDAVLHAVLLAYASDYFLLDMAVRSAPTGIDWTEIVSSSLDHSVWLHRPVRFDRWHLYTHETSAIVGHRGLVRGTLRDEHGALVATVAQEVLMRPASK